MDANSPTGADALALEFLTALHIQADLDALGRVDIVMIGVDGAYTLGLEDARAVIEQMHPRIVLPMHYFTMGNLARFLEMMRPDHAIEVRQEPSIAVSRLTLP